MATGDIVNVTIKDGAGIDRQMPFEEQADGSLAPVHYARGPEGGAILARLSGRTFEEERTESDLSGSDLTFTANVAAVLIANTDPDNDGVFTVNGEAITVPAGVAWGPYQASGTASATVSVSGSTQFIVQRFS